MNKTYINSLPMIAVVLVMFINLTIRGLFTKLSVFEGHRSLTAEKTSFVVKTFLAQLLNTAIIILLVNTRFSYSENFLFRGKFEDFSPLWYRSVGTTLLYTMIVNIFMGPFVNCTFAYLRAQKRCKDRGCGCNPKSTKTQYQEDYNALYTGPPFRIDFRYAGILTQLYVCFIYSAGMPLLYLVTLIFLIVKYYSDKFYMVWSC